MYVYMGFRGFKSCSHIYLLALSPVIFLLCSTQIFHAGIPSHYVLAGIVLLEERACIVLQGS